MKREYTVKVKDYRDNTTHTLHEFASSQNHANSMAVSWLRKALGHDDLDIVGKRRPVKKVKPVFSRADMTPRYKVPMNRNLEIMSKYIK